LVGEVQVTVRYYAGARAAAGLEQELIDAPEGSTIAELTAALGHRHGAHLARVLDAASFLVDEVRADPHRRVAAGATVDVLPPFAGG
jgi:molybdopterin synthase sulfur carrier subunit